MNSSHKTPTSGAFGPLGLERPRFGEFAKQLAAITTCELEDCLKYQSEYGGRIGAILADRKLIQQEQIPEILRMMARWVAATRHADMPGFGFPRPLKLSVCMPAFNEADVIEDCLAAACAILPEFVEDFELIIANDGSSDETGELVHQFSQRDPRVRLVNHEVNRGYGAAVSSGLKAAEGDLVIFTDGDGQFSMLDLPQLLEHVNDVDYVIGYRYERAEGGLRRLNAWSWNRLIRAMLGVRVRDLDCAYKLFPRDVIEELKLTSQGACINAEILTQCARGGLTFCETPVMHYPRYHGAPTGANLKVIIKAFRELPQLWKYRSAPPLVRSPAEQRDETPIPDKAKVSH